MKSKLAHIIAITSGRDETGKTKLLLNLARKMSIKNKKVLIVDTDMNLSPIDELLDVNPEYTLNNLLDKEITADKLLHNGPDGIKILSAATGDILVKQNIKKYQQLLIHTYIGLRDKFDYILINTNACISHDSLDFLIAADKIVIVTTSEPSSITDTYAIIKVLFFRAKKPKIAIIVNKPANSEEAKAIYDKIELIVQHFLNEKIQSFGFVINEDDYSDIVESIEGCDIP